ncbi:MAG: hypothetical protein V4669_01540 [Pseudomonadota bacterium]
MNWLNSYLRRFPRQTLVIGKVVFLAGAILILGAVFARAGLMAVNTERAASKLPALQTLAEAYPQYATWVVPEGPVGFTVAAVLVLVGMVLTGLPGKTRGRE